MLRKHRPCPCSPAPRWAEDTDALHKVLGHLAEIRAHTAEIRREQSPQLRR